MSFSANENEEEKYIRFEEEFKDLILKYEYEETLIIFNGKGGFRIIGNCCAVCAREALEIYIKTANLEHEINDNYTQKQVH